MEIQIMKKTMNKFAVGYISFFDNVLKVEIIEAKDWKDALLQHSCILGNESLVEMMQEQESLDDVINVLYDCDATYDIVEIQ